MHFDTHDMKLMEYVVFCVVRFDTHDMWFESLYTIYKFIKNASFNTHDIKPMQFMCKLLYPVFNLSTLTI